MKIIFLILILFITLNIFSQSNEKLKLDIDLAIKYALTNNFDLQKENLNLIDKKITLGNSWNIFTPAISASASLSRKLEDEEKTSSLQTPSFGFSVEQRVDISSFIKIYQNYLDYKSNKINFEKFKKNLIINIKKTYYNILILSDEIRIKKKSLDNAKDRYNQALIQFKEGDISEVEKLNRELTYKTLIPELSKLENNFEIAIRQFKDILGIENNTEIEFVSLLPEITKIPDYIIDDKFANNYDIISLQTQKSKNTNYMLFLLAQLAPTFKFSYSFSDSYQKDPYSSSDWFIDLNNDWKYANKVDISINLALDPLLPFSAKQIAIINYGNQIKRDELDINKELKKKQTDYFILRKKLEQINETYSTLQLNVAIAEKVYNLTLNELMEGSKNNSDVNEAEKNLFDTKFKILSSKFDYISSILDIEYLLNLDLTTNQDNIAKDDNLKDTK